LINRMMMIVLNVVCVLQFNSCPMRRIPQRYVIGTTTKVDLGEFQLPAHLDDGYFKKNKKSVKRSVKRKAGEDIFASKKEVS
jgi:large subunit ribosomal protein L6e